MALRWTFLLLLTPLLAAQEQENPDPDISGEPQETGRCEVPSDWDPRLQFTPEQSSYALNDSVQLSCAGEYVPSVPHIRCISRGMQTLWNGTATCKEMCQRPRWDSRLQLAPDQENYQKEEEVMLSCPEGFQPSFTKIKCLSEVQVTSYRIPVYRHLWFGRDVRGDWIPIQSGVECIEMCQRPRWDSRLRLVPDQENYRKNEEVMLSCTDGFQPTFTHVKCAREVQSISHGKPVYREVWNGRDSRGRWICIQPMFNVECIEMCQRPRWDSRLQLAPDQENYQKEEEVMLSCPEGFQPSFTKIKCLSEVQVTSYRRPVYRHPWFGRDVRGDWIPIQSGVECIEVFQVVPGTLEISSTSIKLNWTCRLPDTCQHMRATCRLAGPSPRPCEAEEVEGEEMLHGQEGTFICPPLQPFTDYTVTISLPRGRTLYINHIKTKETVPDKPKKLRLNPNMGSLRWKALPSCKGEIIGYQLNVTARSARDGGLLQMERLRLSRSVTEHPLPGHGLGHSYTATLQGVTAIGAGAASLWEFQPDGLGTPHPAGIGCRSVRDVSPSQGTAVLPLQPIARPPAEVREHQLIVAATHNGTVVEGACSGEPQPLNASRQPDTYVAAVLNLTAPTDFVLGAGTRGPGYRNAALRPGCDYTALLRLIQRSQEAEKFTCICYSFSLVAGQPPGPWRGIVIGVVVLLAVLLVSAVILWFVLSRKRKFLPSKAKEDN